MVSSAAGCSCSIRGRKETLKLRYLILPKKKATSKAIPTIDSRTTGNGHLPLGAILDEKMDEIPQQELQIQDEVLKVFSMQYIPLLHN
ncbi:hypothetical protein C0J52_17956 [Blattella germanica]|nr:hypothetical protein C0J52_17956 [Blattella germanica]